MARLWLFNPGHEEALRISSSQSYTPGRIVLRMMRNLSPLMLLLASEGDFVWYPAYGGEQPRLLDHLGEEVPKGAYPRDTLSLSPWALEPHMMRAIERDAEPLGLRIDQPLLPSGYLEASHRSSALLMLHHLASEGWEVEHLYPLWLWSEDMANAQEERAIHLLESYLKGLDHLPKDLMIKYPYSSSGRGVFRKSLPLTREDWRSILKAMNHLGGVSLEPRLSRLEDWAVEYYRSAQGEVKYIGLSYFSTSEDGAYQGNVLESDERLLQRLSVKLGQGDEHKGLEEIRGLIDAQKRYFQSSPLYEGYEGYIGVDWMLYLDGEGRTRLHPCVEINLRATMGLLAHKAFLRYMRPEERGAFVLKVGKSTEVSACYQGHLSGALPEGVRQIIALTTPKEDSNFYAYLMINDTI